MAVVDFPSEVVSITEAHQGGLAGLVKRAEQGTDFVVERYGRPVAAVMSIAHFDDIRELERDLRSAALVLSRIATDTGERCELDDVIKVLGLDREKLEAELAEDLAAGR